MTTPDEQVVVLEIGDEAPWFELPSTRGGTVSLDQFTRLNNVILAFYPQDDAPGSIKEIRMFSLDAHTFATADCEILCVSRDSLDSHKKMCEQNGIGQGIHLLSDVDGSVAKLYGALFGDRKMLERILFLIDKHGKIAYIQKGMPNNDDLMQVARTLTL